MVSITIPLDDETLAQIKQFPWVNWSEVAREKLMKREIFDKYLKTKKISKEDEIFCEEIDWHPVDELPLKEEFVRKIKQIEKGPHSRMTLKELKELMGLE
ncbi:MAG: hypothetical protein KAI26_08880 [Nanoarchaeota archaeon]|nr:hypothetical protein [Nanoarchaeota archaeon]